jgi:hypothetical protein
MQTEKVITLSILMPCLNEARTLGTCISKAQSYLARHNFLGEIIVADSGSITQIRIGSVVFAQHTLIVTCALTSIGIQSAFFWTFAKSVAIQKRLLLSDPVFKIAKRFLNLENCLAAGGLLTTIGLAIVCYGLFY